MRFAICMAVYGRPELTSNVIAQIERERESGLHDRLDLYLCDNKGDLKDLPSWVYRFEPGENLGWLGGSNLAWRQALMASVSYDGFILLNNDVVLSPGFFTHMIAAASSPDIGIIAPLYDDVCRFQRRSSYPADRHVAQPILAIAPYVDGTCMLVTRAVAAAIGVLDDQHFGFFGWGADLDYCIRARAAGFKVAVTESAYLNHMGRATAYTITPQYKRKALYELRRGMTKKYGRFWGFHLEKGLIRKALKAMRSFLTSLAPQLTLAKG